MEPFRYRGRVPSSKSLFIRALVAASYGNELEVDGRADSDDIERTRSGLRSLLSGEQADCGDGGAVLRFLTARASRLSGTHSLTGSSRLLSRPMDELVESLATLGVEVEVSASGVTVTSRGWEGVDVEVDCTRSSQFASALLINSWGLEQSLRIHVGNLAGSAGYWEMTRSCVSQLGMQLTELDDGVAVAPQQEVASGRYEVEPDMSSAFAVAALGAVSGEAHLEGWPSASMQPDARFPDLLAAMGVTINIADDTLSVGRAPKLAGIHVDLGSSPDLFPVLGVLAGLAAGRSTLAGAPQLRHKESDRIAKVTELLTAMGRDVHERDDGIVVSGPVPTAGLPFSFDADHDHRMAMAAAVARQAGVPVTITGADTVTKSFAGFWDVVGWRP